MKNLVLIAWMIVAVTTTENIYKESLVRLIKDAGRKVEVHKVTTEDNYILTVFRLPSKSANPKIVFIMHGLESSAADFVIGGNGASLAYLMADNGFDVWLGNARGNIFSQSHKTLSTDSHDFWKFSFHEIGVYDLPAMIDYALEKGNTTSLTYCGHSQGTTVVFVLLSMRPLYNSKISSAHLLTPVAFMRFPHPYAKYAAERIDLIQEFVEATRLHTIGNYNPVMRKLLTNYCNKRLAAVTMCKEIYMLFGETQNQFNEDLWPKIFEFFPAAAGYRQFAHYGQIINADGNFIRYDHRRQINLEMYGQADPPTYNLSNVQTKIHFLYGTNDLDVLSLVAKLKNLSIGITKLNGWNHLDFIYGKDVHKKINVVILQMVRKVEKMK